MLANPILAVGNPSIKNQRQPINPPIKPVPHPTSLPGHLPLSHSVRIKSAEYWLVLGEADEAVRELEALPSHSWNHPSALKVLVAAVEVLGERTGAIVQK